MTNTDKMSRRNFLRVSGLGAVGLAFSNIRARLLSEQLPRIGFQLYNVRKQIESDLDLTIRKIAEMGYVGVETYPLPENLTIEQAANVFAKNGLEIFGMHAPLPLGDDREAVLCMADGYKCKNVINPAWPHGDKYAGKEGMKRTVELYNEAAAFLKSRGLKLGLHNHWWEFEKVDDIIPFYYLLEHLDPEIFFEIDTYWAATAGVNPSKVVADFGARAPFLHIKDGPAEKGDRMYNHVPAGKGKVDVPGIAHAGNGHTKWMIVEFDEYAGDIFEGMQTSIEYLTKNRFGQGK